MKLHILGRFVRHILTVSIITFAFIFGSVCSLYATLPTVTIDGDTYKINPLQSQIPNTNLDYYESVNVTSGFWTYDSGLKAVYPIDDPSAVVDPLWGYDAGIGAIYPQ